MRDGMSEAAIMDQARALLRQAFGHSDFREGQAEVIEAILQGRNCIVVMPTGGGKSLCYQLPALLLPGRTLVISPLIALMKDQTEALERRGISATFINSSISFEEQKARLTAFAAGRARILYIAPERFRSSYFIEVLRQVPLSLFAIDEAHCISHWGHDFRPDYLRLRAVIEQLGRPPVVALTATATPTIRMDIAEQLGLEEAEHFVAGFDRVNLKLQVQHRRTHKEKLAFIERVLNEVAGSGIIYGATRKIVDSVARELRARGIRALPYHAGLPGSERERAQNAFMDDEVDVIVATNAFGMGIDKPDIRFVIHYNLPDSIDSYYQEMGRAGRDGRESMCSLLFAWSDVRIQEYFIEADHPHPDLIARVYQFLVERSSETQEISPRGLAEALGERNVLAVNTALVRLEKAGHIHLMRTSIGDDPLYHIQLLDPEPCDRLRIDKVELARRAAFDRWKLQQMIAYAQTNRCLRGFILDYFGDRKRVERCGACSTCLGRVRRTTITFRSPLTPLDEFIIESAPSGEELRERLRRTADRRRKLARAERPLPSPSSRETIAIENLDAARCILECVAEHQFRFGQSTIAAMLRGSMNKSIRRWRLNHSPHHGRLSYMKQTEIRRSIDLLIERGYLTVRKSRRVYPLIGLTEKGWELIRK
ncbi:MAG: ATP-dependent DNA helicase RecQ [Acidobacteria bacterium]|nr:MAG: ATP-dependent DNA helicase RecQ [Acidobacteriota bacterium]